MQITSLARTQPFTTKDGSTIRELHHTGAQSLAEASLEAGAATDRHYHRRCEEIYFVLEGKGLMELDGRQCEVGPGDAILIPSGAWHQISAGAAPLRFLCACSPAYEHEDTFFE
jgi:mannose-6-phosphate isomerase-like protein (cupin superfamily)